MGFLGQIRLAALHEIRETLRRPALVLTGLILPLFWVCVMVSTFSTGLMRGLPVAFVDLDASAQSREVEMALKSLPSVKLLHFDNAEHATEAMKSGKVYASLLVPHRWSEKSLSGTGESALELTLAKSYYAIATTLEIDIKTALKAKSLEWLVAQIGGAVAGGPKGAKLALSSLTPDIFVSGNAAFNYAPYLLSVLVPGVFALGIILTMVGVFVREWRERRWSALLATGISPVSALLGKAAPWIAVYSVCACGYVAWFAGYCGNAPIGSVLIWVLGTLLLMLAMVSLALGIVSLSPMWIIALSAAICYCAPIFPFTGFSYPLDSMDIGANVLGLLLPLTWFLRLQTSQWTLGSPLSHTAYLLLIQSLFILVPLVIGLTVFPMRVRRWVMQEAKRKPEKPMAMPQGLLAQTFEGVRRGICSAETFVIFVGAVAFYLAFYAWPYMNQTITDIETAIVDLDKTPASRELIRKFSALPTLSIQARDTDPMRARSLYRRELVSAVIEIPHDYEKDLLANKPAQVAVTINGFYTVKARAVQAAILNTILDEASAPIARALLKYGAPSTVLQRISTNPVSLVDQNIFNSISGYATYIVPLVAPVILQAILFMSVGIVVGGWLIKTEKDVFLEAFLSDRSVFLRTVAGFFFFGLFWIAYAEGLDFAFFNYPALRNVGASLLMMALLIFAMVSLAFAITLSFGSNTYIAQCLVITSAPVLFLSGTVYPGNGFGTLAHLVSWFFPTTPGVVGMVAVSQNGASLTSVMPQVLWLLAQAMIYLALADFLRMKHARRRRLL